jgi:hypothetical protein
MGFVWLLCWAMNCGRIRRWAAIGPSYLVGNCRKFGGTVLAIDLIVLTVHPFEGGRLY